MGEKSNLTPVCKSELFEKHSFFEYLGKTHRFKSRLGKVLGAAWILVIRERIRTTTIGLQSFHDPLPRRVRWISAELRRGNGVMKTL